MEPTDFKPKYNTQNCLAAGYLSTRDLTRFLIFHIQFDSYWTYYEWFYYDVPISVIYDWLKDNVEEVNGKQFTLVFHRNDNTDHDLPYSSKQTLKDFSSFHIMPIYCYLSTDRK